MNLPFEIRRKIATLISDGPILTNLARSSGPLYASAQRSLHGRFARNDKYSTAILSFVQSNVDHKDDLIYAGKSDGPLARAMVSG